MKRTDSRRLHRLCTAAVVAAACACDGTPTAPPFPEQAPPTAYHVNWSAWVYGSHDVRMHGDTLVIVRAPDWAPDSVRTSRVRPGAADWRAFWRAADAAGVRSWPRECADREIMDGGGFSLEIVYQGGRIQASGFNSFPDRNGRCRSGQPTPEVYAFLDAVAALIGAKFPSP